MYLNTMYLNTAQLCCIQTLIFVFLSKRRIIIHSFTFFFFTVTEINFTELSEGVASKKFLVVDIRKSDEIEESGKIPGSFCLPGELT